MDTERHHIFISYCRENLVEVEKLCQDLMDAGEKVWWDKDIKGGQSWEFAIRQAMKQCYVVILCLSKESESRISSGIYPELADAIKVYRQLKPGSVYIIPVRLSECQIPPVEINATQTLDAIQYIDLFPDSRYDEGLRELLGAIRLAPLRP
jgi:TIR domain-containing protein